MRANQLSLAGTGVLVLILVGIWWPEVAHHWTPTPRYTTEQIERARHQPADKTLSELTAISFEPSEQGADDSLSLARASSIMQGQWIDPPFGVRPITLPFDASDLEAGWPTEQLRLASLAHVEVLLNAYETSSDDRFLVAARDVINAWARFERRALLQNGYLWNDHAIAQRVLVLTRYWRLFRQSSIFDEESARLVLEFVGRSGRMLADPGHFTVRTNHGVMQNLALLHIAASFPTLPDSTIFRQVATDRLRLQLPFYQSHEGVVLEHSPGYHALGVWLLNALWQYRDLLDHDFAEEISERRAKACRFLWLLARPDWSLPLIGNTSADPTPVRCKLQGEPSVSAAGNVESRLSVYPVSGYAVVWYGRDGRQAEPSGSSQAVVAWGNFATRAHKHDDEMSIVTWMDGRPIIAGTGYWPYGHTLQKQANSWRGSNGPHFEWERASTPRRTAVLSKGERSGVTALDLLRHSSASEVPVRRQVITVGPTEWLVLDFSEAPTEQALTTVWTLFPGWTVGPQSRENVYRVEDGDSRRQMTVSFASTGSLRLKPLHASESPFGGWVAMGMAASQIRATSSIEVSADSGRPVATLWSAGSGDSRHTLGVRRWHAPTDWKICLDGEACAESVERRGTKLVVAMSGSTERIDLEPLVDQAPAKQLIDAQFVSASERFPAWPDHYRWRVLATQVLVVAFLAQEVMLALLGGIVRSRWRQSVDWFHRFRLVLILSWVAGGLWTVLVYFGDSWKLAF